MADSNLVESIKISLRITTSAFDEDINSLADACIEDMKGAGVRVDRQPKVLIEQAIKHYCRAYFSNSPDQTYAIYYNSLRDAMASRVTTGDENEQWGNFNFNIKG